MNLNVKKRNGDVEELNIDKIHNQVERCCEGIENVSPSLIEINACLQFYDGITTEEIDQMLIRSAVDLINPDVNHEGHVNYQWVAGRLLLSVLRKQVYGKYQPDRLYDIVKQNVERGVYTSELLEWYSEDDWNLFETYIDHSKDERYSHSALSQLIDKYLTKDRTTGDIFETPQIRYIVAASTKFHNSTIDRFQKIRQYYESASNGNFTLATPVLAGLGTPTKQFSSCVVIKADDNLDSIYAAGQMIGRYAAKRAGIGLDTGRLRGEGSAVRKGEIKHTGLVHFIKKWNGDLKCVSQGGIRGASMNVNIPIWHMDIENVFVLKNNQGTDDTRCRTLDYTIVLNGYFLKLMKEDRPIYLFNPNEVPDLYEAFYSDTNKFIELYEKYSRSRSLKYKKKVQQEKIFELGWCKERRDTARIYLMFIDNILRQTPYIAEYGDVIYQTNLCVEILLPTKSFETLTDDSGRIGLCTLGSINLAKYTTPSQLKDDVHLMVEGLSNLLMYQDFLSIQSELHNKEYEPLGIGITGLAQWAAQRQFKYGRPEMLQELKVWMEHLYYYAVEQSIELAKQRGECERWRYTRYAKGQFVWENRKPAVDALCDFSPVLDWESLRVEMLTYGMRNTVLIAVAPVESSSVAIFDNATNGIELPYSLISSKESKGVVVTQVAPQYHELKDYYQLIWDQTNCREYLKTAAVINVYTDQSISTNQFYNLGNFDKKKIPFDEYMNDIIFFYNMGGKTLYYDNTHDPKSPNVKQDEEICEGCKL